MIKDKDSSPARRHGFKSYNCSEEFVLWRENLAYPHPSTAHCLLKMQAAIPSLQLRVVHLLSLVCSFQCGILLFCARVF